MNVRTIVFVLAALLIAGGTAFVARGLLTQKPQPTVVEKETSGKKVLVAKANLPAGTLIKEEDVEWQKWPEDGINAAYLVEGQADTSSVAGAVVRRGIAAGGPITETMIARPGDRGFLAAVLAPGMRAMSIDIDDQTAISGLLFPGDHVDLMLLLQMPELEGVDGEEVVGPDSFEPHVAETILEDVRVIAIDRIINDIEGQEPQKLSTVTVELTPKQVEMVHSVRDIGDLALSLRGLATDKQPAGTPVASISGTKTPSVSFLNVSPADRIPGHEDMTTAANTESKTTGAGASTTIANAATSTSDEGADSGAALDPFADNTVPERGDSVTYDYEVSRSLEDRMLKSMGSDSARVDVVRGSSSGGADNTTLVLPVTQ
ncbi:MAG TPA: Flp pilus assembly protein CpaB [Verrucomicrobiae bacterium]|jgi:pilus assembly protein CpaB|nr:Flp pilus assembly protein CpaB [Verrucomicrobiae bacterium]